MANSELSLREWIDKAEGYCARCEHCASDVRRKLLQWGMPDDFYEPILAALYKNNFLNDERFCSAYVHDKVAYQSWGRIKIQASLRALQLPEKSIQESLLAIDARQYMANLKRLIQQRRADSEDKRMRFLLQRGFTFDEIKKCK